MLHLHLIVRLVAGSRSEWLETSAEEYRWAARVWDPKNPKVNLQLPPLLDAQMAMKSPSAVQAQGSKLRIIFKPISQNNFIIIFCLTNEV